MGKEPIKSFKDLIVWQKAADLAVNIYEVTKKFPNTEIYSLTSQMRRAAISVSSNIAEGFKRNYSKEKIQFYNIAYGSNAELESQIEVAKRLNFINEIEYKNSMDLVIEISKMLGGLIKSIRQNPIC